jgi:LSD1 subclass zinc finger protein
MFIVHCANCNEPLRLPDDAAGKTIRCLKCMAIIMVSERLPSAEPPGHFTGAETKNHDKNGFSEKSGS